MGCRDGTCEYSSRMKRDVEVPLEQRIKADLWLKEYLDMLRKERPDLFRRVLAEEGVHDE